MTTLVVGWLYLPLLLWTLAGVAFAIAYGRAAPSIVLRLAAAFLGLWTILATTVLVFVLANGGWSAIVALVRFPLSIFQARYLDLWVIGSIAAFGVLLVAFVLNQVVARGFLRLLAPRQLDWPNGIRSPPTPTSLFAYASPALQAFSFTLLVREGIWGVRRHEVVLLSDGLRGALTVDEQVAVIAHEVGHLQGLDGRYLTFIRTISRMMRWDPILAYLAESVTRREEFRADLASVGMTGNPLALARALFKANQAAPNGGASPGVGFLGVSGRRRTRETAERIRRLLALAEEADASEGRGA